MIKNLTSTDPELIVDCLHEAFSDYAIPMKMPSQYWLDRWKMANISYELSFGFFDDDQLVGFVLHGLDHWKGHGCFYNMATGVIPKFRGQRIIQKIYQHCKPILASVNINNGYLEVLTNNQKAIRAYESAAFNIIDELLSYQLKPVSYESNKFEFIKIESYDSKKYHHLKHHELSFEHRDEIIERDPNAFSSFELHQKDECIAYAIVKKSNQNLLQFGFLDNNIKAYGLPLLSNVIKEFPEARMVNISKKDAELLSFFNANKFPIFISQYSMHSSY